MAKLVDTVHVSWKPLIEKHIKTDQVRYCLDLHKAEIVCPSLGRTFKAYTLPKDDVQIVILALSPYYTVFHHDNKTWRHATGLAMGVPPFCKTQPPTLRELEEAVAWEWSEDYVTYEIDNTLQSWHDQGVMLLNCALTSVAGADARIHLANWRNLIQETLEELHHVKLFVLMGAEAHKFERHCNPFAEIFKTPHPVLYKRTGEQKDRLAGIGVFKYIKQHFSNLKF